MMAWAAKGVIGVAAAAISLVAAVVKKALLCGAWLVLAVASLAAMSVGILLCLAGELLLGMIVIGTVVLVEWGLL